ncbi:hypothetical protein GCM10019016_016490 [Streptomyces prasinosporus]|uniref:Uncharacterized protein n=1 Tax=Streptomyces prasinosporus TaxID=68256 RepID=A0ABP6TH49_9ACTN
MEVVEWLLRQATTQGWGGFLRCSASHGVQHVVRHEGGFDAVDVRNAWKQISRSWSW